MCKILTALKEIGTVTKSYLTKSQRSVKAKNEGASRRRRMCAFAQVRLCARAADRRRAWTTNARTESHSRDGELLAQLRIPAVDVARMPSDLKAWRAAPAR
jgi:hypothetical protein